MRIKCLDCGNSEEVTLDLFVKIAGGVTAGFGYWAWVSFLFAGTGFAMAICVAIIAGGAAMLAYKDEIIDWIVNKGYPCDGCGSQKWTAVSPELEKEINAKDTRITSLEKEAETLRQNVAEKEQEAFDHHKGQDSSFSNKNVEKLLKEIEEKDSKIRTVINNLVDALRSAGYKATKQSNGWEVREPLGGRVRLKTDEELCEYAKGRIGNTRP